jgi:hypothetical protein
MKEIVKREVPKHDEDGVVAVLGVLRGSLPVSQRKLTEPRHEPATIIDILLKGSFEIELEQQIVRIAQTRFIGGDDR